MKRLLFMGGILLCCRAGAVPRNHSDSVPTGTRAAPSLGTDGMALSDVSAYGVRVCANSGNLTGAGTLRKWVYHAFTSTWMPEPSGDTAMPTLATPSPCVSVIADTPNLLPLGRVLYAADGFGAGVVVYLEGWAK